MKSVKRYLVDDWPGGCPILAQTVLIRKPDSLCTRVHKHVQSIPYVNNLVNSCFLEKIIYPADSNSSAAPDGRQSRGPAQALLSDRTRDCHAGTAPAQVSLARVS